MKFVKYDKKTKELTIEHKDKKYIYPNVPIEKAGEVKVLIDDDHVGAVFQFLKPFSAASKNDV